GEGRDWSSAVQPAPLYTDVSFGPLQVGANEVTEANAALGTAELGLAPTEAATRVALIREARSAAAGSTAADDPAVLAPRPLVLATPGGEVLVFVSADGLLRAVDAASGAPLWSYAPRDRLAREGAARAAHALYPGSLSLIRIGTGADATRRL